MRFRSSTIAAVLLLGCNAVVSGMQNAPEPPSDEPARYLSVQRLANQVTQATLSNGLTVLVQENHTAPVATVRSFVRNTGSAYEGQYLGAGLSHVLEHVVAGGTTKNRTEEEIRQMIAGFGGATNAYTSKNVTAFFIDCPAPNVESCITLVADAMQNVVFEPKEFERELAVVQRELADDENDRSHVQFDLLNETVYQEHPIRHPTIGYLEVLKGTTNQAIIDFCHERYVPNNIVFVVVGDVETQKVLDQVAKEFANARRQPETLVVMPEEPQQLAPRIAERAMEGDMVDMTIAWPTVDLADPDLYPLDVASFILTNGDSSRLVRRLKFDEQLVLSVDSSSYTPNFAPGWFGVFATLKPENVEKAERIVHEEIYRLRDELVSPEELAKAKKQKASELVFDQQTVQQQAESLGRSIISSGDPLFDVTYVGNIQKVTAEQIRDTARRWFTPDRLNTVRIVPLSGQGTVAKAAETQPESPVQKHVLPNGLTVLIKRLPTVPLVSIQAYVLGGILAETEETAGLSELTARMLDKGTKRYTAQQIADFFDSIGGKFGATAGRNTVYLSASVLKDDFAPAADVFGECFLAPTFPEDEYRKVQQLTLGAIAQRQTDPNEEAFEFFYGLLPETSGYHLPQGGKAESVSRLTVDDVRRFHQQYFVPNNMVVSIFGDVDPDEALEVVQERFSKLKPDAQSVSVKFDRDNSLSQPIVAHKQTRKQTGIVILAYPAVSMFEKEDNAALLVLDAITSGYRYPGGWLHEELRGAGLVYFVHAFLITGPAPGYFAVLAQTSPEKQEEVVRRIEANMDRARRGEIPAEEFERAKQMLIAFHAQENTTAAEQAQETSVDQLYGLGYDYDKGFNQRIQAVTLDDVKAVARKYLANPYVLATSSPLPEPKEAKIGLKPAQGGGKAGR